MKFTIMLIIVIALLIGAIGIAVWLLIKTIRKK